MVFLALTTCARAALSQSIPLQRKGCRDQRQGIYSRTKILAMEFMQLQSQAWTSIPMATRRACNMRHTMHSRCAMGRAFLFNISLVCRVPAVKNTMQPGMDCFL